MTFNGWLQILVFFALVILVTRPLGVFMHRVFEGDRQPLPRVFGPIERFLFRLSGVDAQKEQTWVQYTIAMLVFSAVSLVVTYVIERLQHVLPLNPQHFGAVEPALALLKYFTAKSAQPLSDWLAGQSGSGRRS